MTHDEEEVLAVTRRFYDAIEDMVSGRGLERQRPLGTTPIGSRADTRAVNGLRGGTKFGLHGRFLRRSVVRIAGKQDSEPQGLRLRRSRIHDLPLRRFARPSAGNARMYERASIAPTACGRSCTTTPTSRRQWGQRSKRSPEKVEARRQRLGDPRARADRKP